MSKFENGTSLEKAFHDFYAQLPDFVCVDRDLDDQLNDVFLNHALKTLKKDPDHSTSNGIVGQILFNRGSYEQSLRYLEKALEKNPEQEELLHCYAWSLFRTHSYAIVLPILDAIQANFPKDETLLFMRAYSHSIVGNRDLAAQLFLECKPLFKDLAEIFPDEIAELAFQPNNAPGLRP